ncbi:YkgJ family cysteine cluster protein [Arcobacter sp. YIC-464]|uniref:YkgJ family cysteine cluster protein n=1 Tax=Arcobacter sp. YIC-464 TaxID=3376631 RepID=UPI003C1FD672
MKQFIDTTNNYFTFSSCESCEANCCDGRKGTVFSQIILSDFEEIYENYPILFIFGELGYLKPVIILTNGKDFCPHLKDFRCSIYEKRSSICRTYPLSANIDNKIYIDTLCPAVSKDKKNSLIVEDSKANKNFFVSILDNYQDKYIDTFNEFDKFNKKDNLEYCITIKGIEFFKYTKETDNKYMKMHQKSLVHLQNTYFKDLNS